MMIIENRFFAIAQNDKERHQNDGGRLWMTRRHQDDKGARNDGGRALDDKGRHQDDRERLRMTRGGSG